jgi:hypothetical protein
MQASTAKGTVALTSSIIEDLRSGGVAYERVHPFTRDIIHTLFPPPTRGEAFYLGLLANAAIKPCASPRKPEEVKEVAAVITVTQGCNELCRRVGMSYDTVHMYLVIYRTLGFLYEEKQGEQTLYHILLDAYQPPSDLPERLRQLQVHYLEKRPRVRRLVKKIIERIAPLTPVDAEQPPLIGQSSSYPNPLPPSTELLSRIQRGLSSKGVEDPDGQIAMCVAEEVVRVDQISNQDSSQNTSIGRLAPENLATHQKESTGRVDSCSAQSTPLGVPVSAPSRSGELNLPRSQQSDHEGVDSCELAPTPPFTNTIAHAKFAEANLPSQEDTMEVDSLRTNVTINQYSKYITLMMTNVALREQLQRFLATMLEDDETQWRRYNPLIQELTSDTFWEPEAITAALVETLVIHHVHQSLKKPGGYFTKKSRAYCKQLPPHVHDLIQTYGHMTYEELVSSLKSEAVQHKSQDFLSRRKHANVRSVYAPHDFVVRSAEGRGNEQSLAVEQMMMSEQEAKALKIQIKREAAFVQVHGIRRSSQAAYVLDVSIDGVPWTITSKQEWDCYYADLRACERYASQVTGT